MIIETIIAIGLLGILIIAMEVEIMIEEIINQDLIELQINIDQIIMAIQGLQENINQGLLIGPQKVLQGKITIGRQIHIAEIM
jgi:hypothetical protein